MLNLITVEKDLQNSGVLFYKYKDSSLTIQFLDEGVIEILFLVSGTMRKGYATKLLNQLKKDYPTYQLVGNSRLQYYSFWVRQGAVFEIPAPTEEEINLDLEDDEVYADFYNFSIPRRKTNR